MPPEPFKFDGDLTEWKKSQILRFVGRSVLDVGCNTGNLVRWLNSIGIYTEGIDRGDQWPERQFESVVCWNTLEHIENDQEALEKMLRIATKNVILSIPKEDDISLPDSRLTYRPYVDPTHKHYYTRKRLAKMIGAHKTLIELITPIRPALIYNKCGMPKWLCSLADALLWRENENMYCNYLVVIWK